MYKELPKGITVDLNGEVRLAEFDGVHPLCGIMREDARWTGTVALTKRDFNFWGYAPAIEYTYIYQRQQHSNYEFDSHAWISASQKTSNSTWVAHHPRLRLINPNAL